MIRRGALLLAALLLAGPASGWGIEYGTHQELTNSALIRAGRDPAFGESLRRGYGLDAGLETKLILRRGFDDDIDAEFKSGRFEKSKSLIGDGELKPVPDKWRVAGETIVRTYPIYLVRAEDGSWQIYDY